MKKIFYEKKKWIIYNQFLRLDSIIHISFLGNLIESKKNVDIAKIEYVRAKLETDKAQMELAQFLYEKGFGDRKTIERLKLDVDKTQMELDRLLSEHGFLSKPIR